MKRLAGLLILLCSGFLCQGQPVAGTEGLLNIPAAIIPEDGTFSAGVNYLPEILTPKPVIRYNTYNYYAGMAFLPFMEISLRMTLVIPPGEEKLTNQDRSLALKLRVLKERKYLPSVVIGGNDIYTTDDPSDNQLFNSLYIAGTKTFKSGGSVIKASLGCISRFSEWEKDFGIFGGLSYSPVFLKNLSLIAEYDSKHINAGASLFLFRHIYIYSFAAGLKYLTGGMAVRLYALPAKTRE
jgi:hypothetical protein